MNKLFKVISLERISDFEKDEIPVLWNKLPDNLVSDLTDDYLDHTIGVNSGGCVSQVTVVHVIEVEPGKIDKDQHLFYISDDEKNTFCVEVGYD